MTELPFLPSDNNNLIYNLSKPDAKEEQLTLMLKVQELYAHIPTLKRRRNRVKNEIDKNRLTKDIKMRQ